MKAGGDDINVRHSLKEGGARETEDKEKNVGEEQHFSVSI